MRCRVNGVYGKLFSEIFYEVMHAICNMLRMLISFLCLSLCFFFVLPPIFFLLFLSSPPLTSFGLKSVIEVFPQDSMKVNEVFAKGKYRWTKQIEMRSSAKGREMSC